MKNSVRRLSALLAALTMGSAFAVTASAIDTNFIKVSGSGTTSSSTEYAIYENGGYYFKGYYYIDDDAVVSEAAKTVASTGETTYVLKNDNSWIKTGTSGILPSTSTSTVTKSPSTVFVTKPTATKSVSTYKNYSVISGGKYYSYMDAESELKKYFENNTYAMFLYEGDERFFCSDVYFVSTDNDVVYYDYTEGKLVANEAGNAYVYVYTKGGIPFFRLNVSVIRTLSTTSKPSVVQLIPDQWHLDEAGDTTGFTIKCDQKYNANDFTLSVVYGNDIASIVNGKLKTTGCGPIVVRVSNKRYGNVYGEALIYVGKYVSSIYDGYYTTTGGKVVTKYWDYDISDLCNSYIAGWIKSDEGTFIPVIKKSAGTVVNADGTTKQTTVVSYENVSVADLIRQAYGDKEELATIITKYNLAKNGKTVVNSSDDFDYVRFILSQAYSFGK